MKLKPLLVAVILLAALALVAYLLRRPPAAAPPDARVGRPVLDPAAVERAARIELADQGKRVEIARRDASWLVSSYYDLPADLTKLSQLVDDLSRAKIDRLVTRDPSRLERLGFKDTAVTLTDAAGHPVWKLTLGKDADSGGRFLRYDDEPQGYLASLAVYLDTDPKSWADSQLVNLKADDIAAIEVDFPEGKPVTVTRATKDDPWKAENPPAGMRLKEDRINALLSSFANLRFQDTADPTAPDVEAARLRRRTVRLTTFAHQTFTIELGRRPAPEPETRRTEAQSTEDRGQSAMKPEPPKPGTEAQGIQIPKAEAQKTEPQGTENRAQESAAGGPKTTAPSAGTAGPEASTQNPEPKTQNPTAPAPATPAVPPPAGPVYAFVTSSDAAAPVNALMKRRAFQIFDWVFNDLPKKPDEFFEAAPAPPKPAQAPSPPAAPVTPVPAAAPKP